MGLFNVIGSLQNLESAEAAGDRSHTKPSLLANGIGSPGSISGERVSTDYLHWASGMESDGRAGGIFRS